MIGSEEAEDVCSAGPNAAASPQAALRSRYSRKIMIRTGLSRHQSFATTAGAPTGGRALSRTKYASAKYIAQTASRSK